MLDNKDSVLTHPPKENAYKIKLRNNIIERFGLGKIC